MSNPRAFFGYSQEEMDAGHDAEEERFGREVAAELRLRDWFAGQALAGICGDGIPGSHHRPDETAEAAYAYADAMLRARYKSR